MQALDDDQAASICQQGSLPVDTDHPLSSSPEPDHADVVVVTDTISCCTASSTTSVADERPSLDDQA